MKSWSLILGILVSLAQANLNSRTPNNSWSGETSLANHVLRVNLKKGYADVEEDLEIRAKAPLNDWRTPPSATDPLEIWGDLTFPQGTSMVGMLLWNGSTVLKAKLKPTGRAIEDYESVVDRPSTPPPQPRDPALLIRMSETRYSLSIYPVFLNTARKIRLRYFVPIPRNGRLSILPMFHAPAGDVRLEVSGSAYSSIVVEKNGQATSFDVPFGWVAQEFDSLAISVKPSKSVGSLRTSFPDGEWKGEYLWLEAGILDSLLDMSGFRREVVFLWRWNMPEYFLDAFGGISEYGQQAVAHAIGITKTMENAGSFAPELKFGLVHQQQRGVVHKFAMGTYGSPAHQDITTYLAGINAQTLPQLVPARAAAKTVTQRDIDTIKVRAQKDFQELIQKSVTLFSPSQGIIKHIVVVATGPTLELETPTISDIEELALPEGVTIREAPGFHNAWFGVDMKQIEKDHWYDGEYQWGPDCRSYYDSYDYYDYYDQDYGCADINYNFPAQKKLHFTMKLKVGGIPNYYDIAQGQGKLQLAFHSLTPIDSILSWSAYNEKGSIVATLVDTIHAVRTEKDTAVVKIVAASEGVISSVYTTQDMGAVYGVVRDNFSLVALESDSVGSTLSAQLQNKGLPHLKVSEIFLPEPVSPNLTQTQRLKSMLHIRTQPNARVQFMVQGELRRFLEKAEILDLHGRTIATLNVEALRFSGQQEWNGSGEGAGVYMIRIHAGSSMIQKKFILP